MSRRISWEVSTFVLSACFVTSIPVSSDASAKPTCHAGETAAMLRELENKGPTVRRSEMAGDLAVHLLKTENACVTSNDIKTLTRLLHDDDDAMRFWSAVMIGNVGRRARSAIPALRSALTERPCLGLGVNSAQGIRIALVKLGQHVSRAGC
jgi:hypothetical protein